jgi:hypothetical protein
MKNYEFPTRFRALYTQAVESHARGQRSGDAMFSTDERAWLAANGLTPQHLYDYAEDHNGYEGEPGLDHALTIELVRRDYFLSVQAGRPSRQQLDEASLSPKDEKVGGISWLPRLIPKAKAKLRGELPPSLMYCCGGDRRFFKEHDILPAEFLALVWRHLDNDALIVDWVVRRSSARPKA